MSIHIAAKKGEIAETILLPGDPLRAKHVAETFLQDVVCYNEVRGMLGYTQGITMAKGFPCREQVWAFRLFRFM
jgi:purine-nucleoside phosphorylase